MPMLNGFDDKIKYIGQVYSFFGEFIIPMLKDKKSVKTYGDITFYLQYEKYKTSRDGTPIGYVKTTVIPNKDLISFWKKFYSIKDIDTKINFWFDQNPFIHSLEIFFSYPGRLVKNKLCESFHGATPLAHEKKGTFPKYKNLKENYDNFHYGRVTSGMIHDFVDDKSPFKKYLTMFLCVKNKPLLLNGKEYKNNIVAQKKFTHTRRIGENPNIHFIRNTDYVFGNLRVSGNGSDLFGDAKHIYGDISSIFGEIHPDLCGDVSNISGCITNLTGDVTGIRIYIKKPLTKATHIQDLLNPGFMKRFSLLSNEDNQILMKVWSCLAHHTIGVTDEERALFDKPIKCIPPFIVDRWGRKYVKDKNPNYMWVFSINPADIMFAKDVNKCSTCFCLNSGSERWMSGMRCLIALNCVNPNLGVAFKIKTNSIKKMNQFEGIKFKWYEPENATFFQYNSKTVYIWETYGNNWEMLPFETGYKDELTRTIKPIYGHDGINCGHDKQKGLAYLEIFIKSGYKWYRGDDLSFPLTNNTKDFEKDEISDEWKKQIELANQKADEIRKLLKGE